MIIRLIRRLLNPNANVYKYTKYVVNKKHGKYIGDYTYGGLRILDWDNNSQLKIGKFCSFAKEVTILLGGEHRSDWVTTYPFSGKVFNKVWPEAIGIKGHPKSKGDINIGNDVWVGYGATILSGLTIGDGAVIGAMSLVIRNVEPYTIVAGNPAKPIRKRFDDKTIKALLKIKWWNWPEEKIRKNIKNLLSGDLLKFINEN